MITLKQFRNKVFNNDVIEILKKLPRTIEILYGIIGWGCVIIIIWSLLK